MSYVFTATLTPKVFVGFVLGCCLILTPNIVHPAPTNSATLSWVANSESDLAGYKVYQGTTSGSYGPSVDIGNTAIYTAQNLQAGLTYYFATTAYDSSGNESLPSLEVSKQIPASSTDTTPPTVSLTAPSSGSTLSGAVTLTATATDNVGVLGVQFHLNGTNLGAEDTTNSYGIPWDTTTVGDGTYTLSATARDAASNTLTSAFVTVTVSNLSGPQLLAEDFNAGTFGGWTVVDEGSTSAPSAWSASTGSLIQSSNIYDSQTNSLVRLGTYAVYNAGVTWTDYQASLTLLSNDNDALGVMFRYQDAQNYYRFSWDRERVYRRLVKVDNGVVTLLAEDNVPYVTGQTYQVTVQAQGSTLEVGIDGISIFTVTDPSHSTGTLALYSWGNTGTMFDDIVVTTLSAVGRANPNDLNGDGKSDIVWRNSSSGEVAVWLMNGPTNKQVSVPGKVSTRWAIKGVGDVDGDGQADLVWRHPSSGSVAVWLMNGPTIKQVGVPGKVSPSWAIKGVGDVDGDGQADLVWRHPSSGSVAVWLMNGLTIKQVGVPGNVAPSWAIKGVGDVDGDGQADLVWRHPSSGSVAVWLMNGLTIKQVGVPGNVPPSWAIKGLGDVDGNGQADLVWRHPSSGSVAVWLMNGPTIKQVGVPGNVAPSWAIKGLGDVDGNGQADIIWRHTGTGLVVVWQMNGLSITSTGSPGSASTTWEIQN